MRVFVVALATLALFTHGTSLSSLRIGSGLLNVFTDVDRIATILDGKGQIPDDTLQHLDRQLKGLKNKSYPPFRASKEDYALSVGALIGEGDGIEPEIKRVLNLGKQRLEELHELNRIDAELAQVEIEYNNILHAATQATQILGKAIDGPLGGLEAIFGHPIANNWLAMETELLPRLGQRTSAIRRLRSELDTRRRSLHKHNIQNASYLKDLKKHLDLIRAGNEAVASIDRQGSEVDYLKKLRERAQRVEKLTTEITKGNHQARREVEKIQAQQEKKRQKNRVFANIIRIVQLGLSGAAMAETATSGAAQAESFKSNISITIKNTTIQFTPNLEAPRAPNLKPLP